MTIGNINFGVNSKKNFHDFKHDVNSTLGFGFSEPTLIHPMQAKTSIDLQTKSVVRLAPLPCPTFGRIKARQDTIFVPMTDVFEAWNEFISGTGYDTANGSGVPTTADYMKFNQFFVLMNSMNYLPSYNANTFKLENLNNLLSQMFTYSVSINWNPFWNGEDLENNALSSEWRDLDTLILSADTPLGKARALNFYLHILNNLYGKSNLDFQTKLGLTNANTFNMRVFKYDSQRLFNSFLSVLHSFVKPSYFNDIDLSDSSYIDNYYQNVINLSKAFNNAPESVLSVFDQPRTHKNFDYSYVFVPDNCCHFEDRDSFDVGESDQVNTYQQPGTRYKVCVNFYLTPYGKRVMKILNAMAVGERYNDNIELPKLFAYFKAWFDLYDPQRTKNWKQTNCYKLVHNFYDYRQTVYNAIEHGSFNSGDNSFTLLSNFVVDLVKCNYYLGADTFTVAQRYPLQPANGNINSPNMLQGLALTTYQGKNGASDVSTTALATAGAGRVNQGGGVSPLTSLSVIALERLYYAINKESALASNVREIMRVRFGVNIDSTRVLNRSDYDIEIDPVFATVNNDQTMLAEYAGKAVANGSTKRIEFEAPVEGFIIQLFSIVPYGGYNQGSTPARLKRGDYYSDFISMYDSMGYEKMTKGQILGKESVINNFSDPEEYGDVPMLFHHKYRQNLANGGFRFHSERANFSPYFLDRLFSEGDINDKVANNLGQVTDAYSKPIDIVPDTILRTVGLYEGFGNYDRIFYDTTGLSDNFILHMIQDLKYYSPMKSISSSFDTVDHSVDDDQRKAEHA